MDRYAPAIYMSRELWLELIRARLRQVHEESAKAASSQNQEPSQ